MITFEVEKEKLDGWTGKGATAPAKQKGPAAPKGPPAPPKAKPAAAKQ